MSYLSPEALEAIETAHRLFFNSGLTPFNRALKQVASDFGLERELMPQDKREFNSRALALYKWLGRRDYQAHRLQQLRQGNFSLWVYRNHDCPDHAALDALVLPSEHSFWLTHFPANSWCCRCYVAGGRTIAGAIRLRGDPNKVLPSDWLERSSQIGSCWFVPAEFRGQTHPNLSTCIVALEEGHQIGLI